MEKNINLEQKRVENKSKALQKMQIVAKAVGVPIETLTKNRKKMNIIFLNNNSEKENFTKEILNTAITVESSVENGVLRSIITVPDNYQDETPWYFCFQLDKKGTKQAVSPTWNVGKNAKVLIYAYCFGMETDVVHGDGKIYNIGDNSSLEIYEFNFNMYGSYMKVNNVFKAYLGKNAYFKNHYESTTGNLGYGNTRGEVYCNGENSKADFITKNRIMDGDVSKLDIKFFLNGKNSSGMMLSKSVTFEGGKNYFKGTIVGDGDNTSGHINCSEVSMGKCEIETLPCLKVLNPSARLTHEAAVGTLERKSVENLMIKGFSEDEAINFLVNGVLD
ncbi:SufD family Fe-S cluster assembly protein [Candidatus Gracilibacteria bacterium]|nr:SufD family Fe-S cluster assembly protein [Candidatus Gracilibacteria bacterium]